MKKYIFLSILLIGLNGFALDIVSNSTRQNENDVTVHFTLTDDEGNVFQWHGDFKKDVNINTQLEAQKERVYELILKRQYRGARPVQKEDESNLDAMKRWIAEGAVNPAITEEIDGDTVVIKEAETIQKREWRGTHPKASEIDQIKARLDALEAKK